MAWGAICKQLRQEELSLCFEYHFKKFEEQQRQKGKGGAEITVAESLAGAKSFHTNVWSRLLRAENGDRVGDGGGASAAAITKVSGEIESIKETVEALKGDADATKAAVKSVDEAIGKVNENILDIDGQLSTLSDDGEATRRDVQSALTAQQGVSADMSEVKAAQQRADEKVGEISWKADNLTVGLKESIEKLDAVGQDTVSIRDMAAQIREVAANVAVLQSNTGCPEIVYCSPGGTKHKKKGPKSLTNSPA